MAGGECRDGGKADRFPRGPRGPPSPGACEQPDVSGVCLGRDTFVAGGLEFKAHRLFVSLDSRLNALIHDGRWGS